MLLSKVLLHASERKKQSEHEWAQGEVSLGAVPYEVGLDTMLDCIELTKEIIQREALYIGADSEVVS